MSTVKTNNVQVGQSATATNNFTWYQPSTPDGTVRLGVGNSGATTGDVVTVNSSGLLNPAYTGTLTGGTGIVNLGSGQFYKDASGNVGIGTSSPGGKLEVAGGSFLFANNQFLQQRDSSGNAKNIFGANSSNEVNVGGMDGSSPFATIRMFTGGSERARIDSSGNLLVNQVAQIGAEKLGVTSGTTNATTYTTIATKGGSTLYVQQQQTTSVSTSATVILTPGTYVALCLVHGSDGTNRFVDLVLFSIGTGTFNVISSLSASGTPASRTYSQSASTYRVAMGSGTYTVQVSALSMTS